MQILKVGFVHPNPKIENPQIIKGVWFESGWEHTPWTVRTSGWRGSWSTQAPESTSWLTWVKRPKLQEHTSQVPGSIHAPPMITPLCLNPLIYHREFNTYWKRKHIIWFETCILSQIKQNYKTYWNKEPNWCINV